MSVAEVIARAGKKKAAKTGGAKRKPASKCSALVRKRDALDAKIKGIEKANTDALKKEQDKIEARHQAKHKKLDAEKAKQLEQLASKYGQACVVKPRKPRSDKGKTAKSAGEQKPARAKTTARAKKTAPKAKPTQPGPVPQPRPVPPRARPVAPVAVNTEPRAKPRARGAGGVGSGHVGASGFQVAAGVPSP